MCSNSDYKWKGLAFTNTWPVYRMQISAQLFIFKCFKKEHNILRIWGYHTCHQCYHSSPNETMWGWVVKAAWAQLTGSCGARPQLSKFSVYSLPRPPSLSPLVCSPSPPLFTCLCSEPLWKRRTPSRCVLLYIESTWMFWINRTNLIIHCVLRRWTVLDICEGEGIVQVGESF